MDQCIKVKRPLDPRQSASVFSVVGYMYTLPIFLKGYWKTFTDEDIPKVPKSLRASKLGDILEQSWKKEITSKSPSIWRMMRSVYGSEFIKLGLALAFNDLVLRILRSLALTKLVRYFSHLKRNELRLESAYIYGGLIITTSLIINFVTQHTRHHLQQLGLKIRVACTSLIYRKTLRLTKSALDSINIGYITNLISKDIKSIEDGVVFMHYFWICPLEIVLTILILYNLLDVTSTAGVFFMSLLIPLQVFLGRRISDLYRRTATYTDERIRLMSQIISGIKVIKMFTWEKPFLELVRSVRRLELHNILVLNNVRGFMKFVIVVPKIGIFLTISIYIITGNEITATYVFAVTSFYNNLKQSISVNFLSATKSFEEVRVSFNRLLHMLVLDEIEHSNGINTTQNKILNCDSDTLVDLQKVSARWTNNTKSMTLNEITLQICRNQLIGLVGPVGSGKSSIFHAILRELPLEKGTIRVGGKISYASQVPWIFTGNIQQNILFGQRMDIKRYNKVLHACALDDDIESFPYSDQTLVGERGAMLSGGQKSRINLARAVYRKADLYLLDDPLSAVDVNVGQRLFKGCIQTFLKGKSTILITNGLQYLKSLDRIYIVKDGKISSNETWNGLNSVFTNQSRITCGADALVPCYTNPMQETRIDGRLETQNSSQAFDELKNSGGLSTSLWTYLNSGQSMSVRTVVVTLFIMVQLAFSGSDYFIAHWVNQEQKNEHNNYVNSTSKSSYVYIYMGIILTLTVLMFMRSHIFFRSCIETSVRLHESMSSRILYTSLEFFQRNNSGTLLNIFSRDMGIIDEWIPLVIIEFLQVALTVLGSVIMICSTNIIVVITTVIISSMFYCLRDMYMRSCRQLVRLEVSSRAPPLDHISETLRGVTTVRALNANAILVKEFDNHLDWHSSIYHLSTTCSRAFALHVDILCVIFIAVVIFSTLWSKLEHQIGTDSMSIIQAITLVGILQWGVFQTSAIENMMPCFKRAVIYSRIVPECNITNNLPPLRWPELGKIEFVSVSLKYSSNERYALKSVSFSVEPMQNVGIVGRTGAGKTSLASALFQIYPTTGSILIDGIDITKLSLNCLRSKISIIPQDPFLFSGSLRENLDPFDQFSNLEIWTALEEVQLKPLVSELPLGLNQEVLDGGTNFSAGQRQLICLARVLLSNNQILILDEATANMDSHTDYLIENTIRKKFNGRTVLTIAHSLNTIIEYDKILVMDEGEVVEYDHPHLLLRNKDGVFYGMLQELGKNVADSFCKVAEKVRFTPDDV